MMLQILLHLWGDYIMQSQWMADNKGKNSIAALTHALAYAAVFLILEPSWEAWTVIFLTHFLIDRFRLARYVVYAKNVLGDLPNCRERIWGPAVKRGDAIVQEQIYKWSWSNCCDTGYPKQMPLWMSVWLTIIADNCIHLTINYLALTYL